MPYRRGENVYLTPDELARLTPDELRAESERLAEVGRRQLERLWDDRAAPREVTREEYLAGKRVKIFDLSPAAAARALAGDFAGAGGVILGVQIQNGRLRVKVWDDSFPVVPEGELIPAVEVSD